VAYVGLGGNLRQRIEQHLIRRDSSVVAGIQAVGLRAEHVRQVDWSEDAGFSDDERLQAVEVVAFDVLEPALRSRGGIGEAARALSKDDNFRTQMHRLFRGQPSGRLPLPALGQLPNQVADLERRLASIRTAVARTAGVIRLTREHRDRLLSNIARHLASVRAGNRGHSIEPRRAEEAIATALDDAAIS
jgi:hypothetical protein